jgi:hypothetical protein
LALIFYPVTVTSAMLLAAKRATVRHYSSRLAPLPARLLAGRFQQNWDWRVKIWPILTVPYPPLALTAVNAPPNGSEGLPAKAEVTIGGIDAWQGLDQKPMAAVICPGFTQLARRLT